MWTSASRSLLRNFRGGFWKNRLTFSSEYLYYPVVHAGHDTLCKDQIETLQSDLASCMLLSHWCLYLEEQQCCTPCLAGIILIQCSGQVPIHPYLFICPNDTALKKASWSCILASQVPLSVCTVRGTSSSPCSTCTAAFAVFSRESSDNATLMPSQHLSEDGGHQPCSSRFLQSCPAGWTHLSAAGLLADTKLHTQRPCTDKCHLPLLHMLKACPHLLVKAQPVPFSATSSRSQHTKSVLETKFFRERRKDIFLFYLSIPQG